MGKRKKQSFKIEDLGTVELPEEQHLIAVKKIQEADREIEQMRIQIRWGTPQVETVKQAASLMGVPYQTYIKQALFKQALQDITQAEKVVGMKKKS